MTLSPTRLRFRDVPACVTTARIMFFIEPSPEPTPAPTPEPTPAPTDAGEEGRLPVLTRTRGSFVLLLLMFMKARPSRLRRKSSDDVATHDSRENASKR